MTDDVVTDSTLLESRAGAGAASTAAARMIVERATNIEVRDLFR